MVESAASIWIIAACQTTWCHTAEDNNFYSCCLECLKSHFTWSVSRLPWVKLVILGNPCQVLGSTWNKRLNILTAYLLFLSVWRSISDSKVIICVYLDAWSIEKAQMFEVFQSSVSYVQVYKAKSVLL